MSKKVYIITKDQKRLIRNSVRLKNISTYPELMPDKTAIKEYDHYLRRTSLTQEQTKSLQLKNNITHIGGAIVKTYNWINPSDWIISQVERGIPYETALRECMTDYDKAVELLAQPIVIPKNDETINTETEPINDPSSL